MKENNNFFDLNLKKTLHLIYLINYFWFSFDLLYSNHAFNNNIFQKW